MKNVLIIDDSQFYRTALRKELDDKSIRIFEAKDAESGIVILKNNKIDLITLDVEMPIMDGFEVCAVIRKHEDETIFDIADVSSIPIVFVTGNDSVEGRIKGYEVGATDFFSKKFNSGELLLTVKSLLQPNSDLINQKVLVVDDTRVCLKITCSILAGLGAEVIPFSDGTDAFEYCEKHLESVDLILTDLYMKDMDGDVLCRKLRKELSCNIPIIFLTAEPRKEVILDLIKIGATDFLTKPFLKEELVARIGVHLKVHDYQEMLKSNLEEMKTLLNMKNRLLKVCAHDLRSPLNGILGLSEILIEEPKAMDEEQLDLVKHINDGGFQVLQLVGDLLDFTDVNAKSEVLELNKVPYDDVINSVISNFQQLARLKNIDVTYRKNTKLEVVRANELAFTRIFSNLISNAIKFTAEGGNISIIVEELEIELLFLVQDSGIGIPQNQIKNIFEASGALGREGTAGEKSIGLGMGIVKELIDKQNCTINVESKENEGTLFLMNFPKWKQG
jgi:DNA-binding response OmpR family regulator